MLTSETISPLEIIAPLQLTDAGRLLFLFESAKEVGITINPGEADAMAFLLSSKRVLPFSYAFNLNPLPVSTNLRDDISHLVETLYLVAASPVQITPKGSMWVSELLARVENGSEAVQEIAKLLLELISAYRKHAFAVVYSAISS